MLLGAWLIVSRFEVDVVGSLINIFKSDGGAVTGNFTSALSRFLTAMILAGGSAGVYNIMVSLGFRTERESAPLAPQVGTSHAWLAIRVPGAAKKQTEITVKIRKLAVATDADPAPIAGNIGADRPRIKDLFLRSLDRFPSNGGYTLEANTVYEIAVVMGATQLLAPTKFVFAPRAIVDWKVSLPEA